MAYVKCIYGSSDTPSPTPSTKRQGINVYRQANTMADYNRYYQTGYDGPMKKYQYGFGNDKSRFDNLMSSNGLICYIGGYPLYYEKSGNNDNLYVEIDGVKSSISFYTNSTDHIAYLIDIRYELKNVIILVYSANVNNSTYDIATSLRYIWLRTDNTLFQSAAVLVSHATTDTNTYWGSIGRPVFTSKQNLAGFKTYHIDSNNTEYLYLQEILWNPNNGSVTSSLATSPQFTSSATRINLKTTNYDMAYFFVTGSFGDRIYSMNGYNVSNATIVNNTGYLEYRLCGKLDDGSAIIYKQGHIVIVQLDNGASSMPIFKVLNTYNIITDSRHADYFDFLVISIQNNIMTFYMSDTRTILGVSKPAGFYRIKFTPTAVLNSYDLELMDDFAEVYVGNDGTKTHPMYWGPDSDPFNGVFIYDIDE